MPRRLRWLTGEDVATILGGFDFERVAQRGSHLRLRRVTSDGHIQTLLFPLNDELRPGTILAAFQQACEYLDESQLRPHFYSAE